MELQNNQVVQLRNGIFGLVSSFNNKPLQLIFRSYTNPVSRYDNNFKNKNCKLLKGFRKICNFFKGVCLC